MVWWNGGAGMLNGYPQHSTAPHIEPAGICAMEWYWLVQCWTWVTGYGEIPDHDEQLTLHGLISAWHEYMRNYTHYMDIWMLCNSTWHQVWGMLDTVFYIMRWCLSTSGSLKWILLVTDSSCIIPVSLLSQYLCIYQCWETLIIHEILFSSKSFDSNKDLDDKQNILWL
jgi:hypothetical protein